MSLLSKIKGKGASGFGYGSTAEDVTAGVDLTGKRILLTGCNSGIGLETLRVLGMRGATMVAAARTEAKASEAMRSVGVTGGEAVACELSEPASVRACVEGLRSGGKKLDVIVCNAGIMALPKLTLQYGYELQFLTNHIGHFILVTGLLDLLAPDGRVVMVSSEAHRSAVKGGVNLENLDGSKGYSAWGFYGQSKLCNILMAKELARRFASGKQVANALHPGVIQTNLGRHMNPIAQAVFGIWDPLVLKNIPEGAATQAYLAAHPDGAKHNGEYFSDSNIKRPTAHAEDAGLAKRLWEESERIVASL